MSDGYGYPERRRKGKDKKRDRKKHPYKIGGGLRSLKFKSGSEEESEDGKESRKKK
jgi:hypothetical protein